MARRLTLRDLLDRLEPQARDAFLGAIQALSNDVAFAQLEDAIRRGNVDAAMAALHLDQASAYFEPLHRALRDAFTEGGNFAFYEVAAEMRRQGGGRVVGRLDATNPRAEFLLRQRSSSRIVEIAENTRAMVRELLGEAMTTDASPRKVALDIVGRVNRASGRREGGLLGLTTAQARYVANARAQLRSGDPVQMAAYLERNARDRRYDSTVRKAIREEKPVADADVDRIAARYYDRLLKLRGETIARTELAEASHVGRDEGIQQMIDRGDLRDGSVVYEWDATADRATRDSHLALDGKRKPRGEPFVSPYTNARMLHPGDRSLGAPAEELINCRCTTKVRLDMVTGLRDRLSVDELARVRAAMAEG